MEKIKIIKYSNEVYFVKCGNKKHFLFIENCDVENTLMLFCVVMFDEFIINRKELNIDISFWKEWIAFFEDMTNLKRNVVFEGFNGWYGVNFANKKIDKKTLLYSGGTDSTVSKLLLKNENVDISVFMVQAYEIPEKLLHFNYNYFSTNIDDIFYHTKPLEKSTLLLKILPLEILFPIISNYKMLYTGIENNWWVMYKEFEEWDIHRHNKLLLKYGVVFDSVVKNKTVLEIAEIAEGMKNEDFIRCKGENKYGSFDKNKDYCYRCVKCCILYLNGANKEKHGFNRDLFKSRLKEKGLTLSEYLDDFIYSSEKFTPTFKKYIKLCYEEYTHE